MDKNPEDSEESRYLAGLNYKDGSKSIQREEHMHNKSLPEIAEDMLSSEKTSPERKDIARRFLASLDDLHSDYEDIQDVPEEEIEALENEFIKELSATSTQFYIKG